MAERYLLISNNDRDPDEMHRKAAEKVLSELSAEFDFMNVSELSGGKFEYKGAIVLGGDGTLIRVAGILKEAIVPILGINTGTVGYLTGAESSDLPCAIKRFVSGDFISENRMMLDVYFNGEYATTVLNDCVVTRSGYSRIITVSVRINGTELFVTSGDGVIVSTPTGSTGYNLSAGGMICVPEASMILITPICPHSVNGRAVIASDSDVVEIVLLDNRRLDTDGVGVTMDGSKFLKFGTGDRVTVKRSKYSTCLVRTDDRTFFETLNSKLS